MAINEYPFTQRLIVPLQQLKAAQLISSSLRADTNREYGSRYFTFSDFLKKWSGKIEFKLVGGELVYFTIEANEWVDDEKKHPYEFALHYHPEIRENPGWSCIDEFEKSPHFHLSRADRFKVCIKESPEQFSISGFFVYLASRFHRNQYLTVRNVLKHNHHKLGLYLGWEF